MQFSEDLLQLISKMLNIPIKELTYEKDEEIGGYYFKSTKLGKGGANMLIDEDGNYKMIFSRNSKECIEQFKKGKRDGKFDIVSDKKKNKVVNEPNNIRERKESINNKEDIDNSNLMETINNLSTRNDDFIHRQLMRRIRMAKFLMVTSESAGQNLIFAYKDEEKLLPLAFTSYQEFNKWNKEKDYKNYQITECRFKDFTKVILDYPNAYAGLLLDPSGVNFKIDMNFINEILMDAPGAKDNKQKTITREEIVKRNDNIRSMNNIDNLKTEKNETINTNINEQYNGMSGLISINNMYL